MLNAYDYLLVFSYIIHIDIAVNLRVDHSQILRSSVVDAGELVSLLPGQGAPFVRAILYERLKRCVVHPIEQFWSRP